VACQGEDCLEISVDIHEFNYLARKGVNIFKGNGPIVEIDMGFVVQVHSI
jgi:hypothetical protein